MNPRNARQIAAGAALVTFAVHLLANPHYGFFRDELYFIICGMHPQFGYVDQPPVVPLLAAGTQLFGHSLVLLRAVPALFAAGGAYVVCMLAFEFGGSAFAASLAVVVYFFTGVLTNFGMKAGTDEVGLWLWPLIALLVVRIARGADPRLWLAVGASAGICLESKYSVAFFLFALFVGVVATPLRATLASRWFAAGTALAVLIALPNVMWQ
ncbi:MAG: glycosyltransferase family 39 protein, partial [Candidatus Eremiobacteraeota bacterium]|nr:glycosyltransferase family 39 protein [Candidatus Eremiobacteraeota bacterium]